MLYNILKPIVRLAMLLFCRSIHVNKRELLKKKGPLLLACNHPNSFLDAVVLAELFKQPIHSLARGDVFKNRFYIRLLKSLNISPIYRNSEGAENLSINFETFAVCKEIFKQNGIVLIFSEGQCINEWHLRPLKKGTARLAFASWDENIPLEILPVGINYSSFRRFSKNVFVNFGEVMTAHDFDLRHAQGRRYQFFTNELQDQLQKLVFEIDKNDLEKQRKLLEKKPGTLLKILLAVPAAVGWLLHAPLYWPIKDFTFKKTWNNDHYDAVLIALLILSYPFYVLLITAIAFFLTHSFYSLLLCIIMPFTAWAYTQVKPQLDRQDAKISLT